VTRGCRRRQGEVRLGLKHENYRSRKPRWGTRSTTSFHAGERLRAEGCLQVGSGTKKNSEQTGVIHRKVSKPRGKERRDAPPRKEWNDRGVSAGSIHKARSWGASLRGKMYEESAG